MEIISYSKIVNELKQACTLEPDCAAVVFDSSTGELVAWSGHKSNQEAVSTAAALFGLWNSQSETAGQHDDTLEVVHDFMFLDIKIFSDFDYEDPGQVELHGTSYSTAGFKRLLWWNMYSCHSGIQ